MFSIKEINKIEAKSLIEKFHYSKILPRLNKVFLGGFVNGELVAVMTLGWGVRPLHTIKKLFPSLRSKDYFEIGKLCLDERMPRNSESMFISKCLRYTKKTNPEIKLIFTWSDGMLGKPGFVYQASNFLYGGFIWTDSYFTKNGIKIHPRSAGSLCELNAREENKEKLFWLTDSFQNKTGILRIKGQQFKYLYFLCSHKERKELLRESSVQWTRIYPKQSNLKWKRKINGKYEFCGKPNYRCSLSAKEVSRVKHLITNQEGQVQFLSFAYQKSIRNTREVIKNE